MISFDEKLRLMALLPEFQLLTTSDCAEEIRGRGAVEAKSCEEVLAAAALGLDRKEIFYTEVSNGVSCEILDKCRIVARSMEDLIAINEAAARAGKIVMAGLWIVAEGFQDSTGRGLTLSQLRGMVHDMKQLKNVSVCGCIVVGDALGLHGKELGKYIRSSYQTAKGMTYIPPCTMPYIVVAGAMEAIAKNEAEHPEDFEEFLTAANIVGMQNTTAFYAGYYIQ